ncbi:MAG: GYD domain-containing protein [Gammaproteobacteria bacterium]|nr:GYD domain-containing protein [Gammaproteobacteria bacterium]
MPTFVTLVNFTDQGIKTVKESPERLQAFKAMAEKMGLKVKDVYYTVGSCDIVTITEGTGEALTAALLKIGSMGNIRTQTMRGFSPEEFKKIVATI